MPTVTNEPYIDIIDPQSQAQKLDVTATEAQQLLDRDRNRALTLQGKLETMRERGISSKIADLRAKRTDLERDVSEKELTERAIEFVQKRVLARLEQRNAALAGPITPVVRDWYHYVTGKHIADVAIRPDGAIETLRFADFSADADVSDLSHGAADQLALLVRLGFAQLLAERRPSEPMPVVLDDVLVNSDEQRRPRLLEIIGRLSTQTQVIILTCDPGPYLGYDWHLTGIERLEVAS